MHGMGVVPSGGIHKGQVVDVGMVEDVVQRSVNRAKQDLGRRVTDAYIGVTCANSCMPDLWRPWS